MSRTRSRALCLCTSGLCRGKGSGIWRHGFECEPLTDCEAPCQRLLSELFPSLEVGDGACCVRGGPHENMTYTDLGSDTVTSAGVTGTRTQETGAARSKRCPDWETVPLLGPQFFHL